MVATDRINAETQIDLSYSAGGASVHSHLKRFLWSPQVRIPNGISIDSAVVARFTVVTNTHETDRHTQTHQATPSDTLCMRCRPKTQPRFDPYSTAQKRNSMATRVVQQVPGLTTLIVQQVIAQF